MLYDLDWSYESCLRVLNPASLHNDPPMPKNLVLNSPGVLLVSPQHAFPDVMKKPDPSEKWWKIMNWNILNSIIL